MTNLKYGYRNMKAINEQKDVFIMKTIGYNGIYHSLSVTQGNTILACANLPFMERENPINAFITRVLAFKNSQLCHVFSTRKLKKILSVALYLEENLSFKVIVKLLLQGRPVVLRKAWNFYFCLPTKREKFFISFLQKGRWRCKW